MFSFFHVTLSDCLGRLFPKRPTFVSSGTMQFNLNSVVGTVCCFSGGRKPKKAKTDEEEDEEEEEAEEEENGGDDEDD